MYGFNGKAASGIVNDIDESGNHAKGSYAENVVIFQNGQVIKETTHGEQGQGVNHSTNSGVNSRGVIEATRSRRSPGPGRSPKLGPALRRRLFRGRA